VVFPRLKSFPSRLLTAPLSTADTLKERVRRILLSRIVASRRNLICERSAHQPGPFFPKHAVTAKAGLKQDPFVEQEV